MNDPKSDNFLLLLLRLGAFLCFAGWSWVHCYWEGPYGVLLWHDHTYWLAEQFGVSWEEYLQVHGILDDLDLLFLPE